MARGKRCRDCVLEGITTKRPTPHRGPRCRTHHLAMKREQSKARHEARVMDQYGLSSGDYDRLLASQGGRCALCPAKGLYKRLAIDHDHKCCAGPYSCGKCVRGLLCGNCNSILGRWRDDADRFRAGAAYLESPPAQAVLRESPSQRVALEVRTSSVVQPTLPLLFEDEG